MKGVVSERDLEDFTECHMFGLKGCLSPAREVVHFPSIKDFGLPHRDVEGYRANPSVPREPIATGGTMHCKFCGRRWEFMPDRLMQLPVEIDGWWAGFVGTAFLTVCPECQKRLGS